MTLAQKERARIRAREWRTKNRERHRAYTRAYWAARRTEKNEKNKEWNRRNPDLAKAHQKAYRERHPEACKLAHERYWTKRPEARKLWCAARRARTKANGGELSEVQWLDIKRRYGFRCLKCGKKKPLTIDHVVPIAVGGLHDPSNVQPLCLECNSSKHIATIDYRPAMPLFI